MPERALPRWCGPMGQEVLWDGPIWKGPIWDSLIWERLVRENLIEEDLIWEDPFGKGLIWPRRCAGGWRPLACC